MIAALVDGRPARAATPGARGFCPACSDAVYARRPDHAIPHWAHIPLPDGQERDCTINDGEETEWHKAWKNTRTDPAYIEFSREANSLRTDVLTPGGYAVEFQHSAIKPEVITRREEYWKKGVWVIDGTPHEDGEPRIDVKAMPDQDPADPWRIFRWPYAPPILYRAKWPLWIDTGDELVQVQTMIPDASPRQGRGWTVTRDWFVEQVINGTRAIFKTHRVPSSKPQAKRAGHARAESDDDLEVIPVCIRTSEPGPTPVRVADTIGGTLRHISTPRTAGPWPRDIYVPALSWRDRDHWNDGRRMPCIHCGQSAFLLDDAGQPSHKVCAEEALYESPWEG